MFSTHLSFIYLKCQLKQSIEQLKSDINDIKVVYHLSPVPARFPKHLVISCFLCSCPLQPELIATEVSSLEKELKVLLSEKDGELEYLKSLRSQIDKLKVQIKHFQHYKLTTLSKTTRNFLF